RAGHWRSFAIRNPDGDDIRALTKAPFEGHPSGLGRMSRRDLVCLAGDAIHAPYDCQRIAVGIGHGGGQARDWTIMRTTAVQGLGHRTNERRRLVLKRADIAASDRSEEHTSELQSLTNLVCRLLLEK